MIPALSSRASRIQHGVGERPTFSASASFVMRPSRWMASRIVRSMASSLGVVMRHHDDARFRLSIALIMLSNEVMTMWHPDPSLIRRPAYLSLADQIARAIHDGRLSNGEQLPTHRRMAEDVKLSV